MKKWLKTFFYALILLFVGCTEADVIESKDNDNIDNTISSNYFSLDDVIKISDSFRNQIYHTRQSSVVPSVEYLITDNNTRANNSTDTVAYVLNYPENSGFIIISYKKIPNPIIAFSEHGLYNCKNKKINEELLYRLSFFVSKNDNTRAYEYPEVGNLTAFHNIIDSVHPKLRFHMGQGAPWNLDIPNSYMVGCYPLALGAIMARAKSQLNYGDSHYDFKKINDVLYAVEHNLPHTNSDSAKCVQDMASLLSIINKNTETENGPTESITKNRYIASYIFNSAGYKWPASFTNFKPETARDFIKNKCLLLMLGANPNNSIGHAWVADGFVVDRKIIDLPNPGFPLSHSNATKGFSDPIIIDTTYLYFDWGYYGENNGYFSGDIFTAGEYGTYKATMFFPVTIE